MNSPAAHRTPDAVVIGGGIVGVCVALCLQRSGRSVMVVERDTPGGGASGHNGGIFSVGECVPTATPGIVRSVPRMLRDPTSPLSIRWPHLPRLLPWLARFTLNSRRDAVERIAAALHSLTSHEAEAYQPLVAGSDAAELLFEGGMLIAYEKAETFAGQQFVYDLRRRHGINFDVLDDPALAALDPGLEGRFQRVIHMRDSMFTSDPQEFTRRLAARFVTDGGTIIRAEVTGLERRNRRVEAVVTDDRRQRTGSVVVAAGVWSRRFARLLGVRVPLEAERGYGVDLPDPRITLKLPILLQDAHVGLRHRGLGLRLSGIDELASVSAPPNLALTERLTHAARRVFPELRIDGARPWMHCRPSLPDSLPVIGRAPRYDNAIFAFGHGHKGLGQAAITGKLVQELADHHTPSLDLAPFSPTRFSITRRRR